MSCECVGKNVQRVKSWYVNTHNVKKDFKVYKDMCAESTRNKRSSLSEKCFWAPVQ